MPGRARIVFMDRSGRIGLIVFLSALAALALAPYWASRQDLRLLAEIYAYVALASAWNLLAGYAGLVSVGQHAYVGLGGYLLFALTMFAGVSPLWAVPLVGILAAAVSVPVAALVFRLRGHYFAIGTWVVAEVFRLIAAQVSALGGGSGTSLPAGIVIGIAATRETREFLVYWTALAVTALVLGLIVGLLRSRYGLALMAIRDNEIAALSNGVGVRRVKFIIYVTTAFCTAMVGAVIFLQKLRISPDAAFSINDWTAFVIFIAVIGGIRRVEGPIVGTAIFFLLRQLFADLGSLYLLMLGAVAILIMLKAPRGVWGLLADRFGLQIFPLQRRVAPKTGQDIKHDIKQQTSERTS
jgi:branched-chain amino acid transport system permease protein